MSIRITMTKAIMGEAGAVLAVGSTNTVSDGFAKQQVWLGNATDTDRVIPEAQRPNDQDNVAIKSLVSGAWNGYRTVLFGDSMVDTYETVVANLTGVYDNATGILTVTSTAHQQAVGWYLTIWNKSFTATNKLFRVAVLTTADANTFTVNIGAGLGITASAATWRYRPESWRSAQSMFTWLQGVSGQRFNLLYNGGSSGDRADEALARIDADCLDYRPDLVICQMPGINDLGTAYTTMDIETIVTARHAIVDRITEAGIRLVLLTTTPVLSGESRGTLQNMGKVIEMNRRLAEYVRGKGNVLLFDAWRLIVDPADATGLAKSSTGYLRTADNIHYSMRGGRAVAEALWAQISSAFPSNNSTLPASAIDSHTSSALTLSSVTIAAGGVCTATASATGTRVGDRRKIVGGSPAFNEWVTIASVAGSVITFASTNTVGSVSGTIRMSGSRQMIDNPVLATATGGTIAGVVSGVCAAGIKANNVNGTPTSVVASVVSRSDGIGNDQQLVITSAAASNQVSLEADFAFAATNWPTQVKAGRRYVFECEIALTNVSGSNLSELRANLVAVVGGTTYQVYALNGYNDGPVLNSDLTALHVRTAPMLLPAGSVTNFKWQVLFAFSAAGTALTAKVGRLRLDEYES